MAELRLEKGRNVTGFQILSVLRDNRERAHPARKGKRNKVLGDYHV